VIFSVVFSVPAGKFWDGTIIEFFTVNTFFISW
jgi:hypothetical protein